MRYVFNALPLILCRHLFLGNQTSELCSPLEPLPSATHKLILGNSFKYALSWCEGMGSAQDGKDLTQFVRTEKGIRGCHLPNLDTGDRLIVHCYMK